MNFRDALRAKVEEKSLQIVARETGLNRKLIKYIIDETRRKFHKQTLDILYEYLRLPHDDFYRENMKKWNPKTESLVGNLVRYKRLQQNLDLHDFSKKIRTDRRAVARIEAGESLPSFKSFTFEEIFEKLDFDDQEKNSVKSFIQNVRDMEKILRKYEKNEK